VCTNAWQLKNSSASGRCVGVLRPFCLQVRASASPPLRCGACTVLYRSPHTVRSGRRGPGPKGSFAVVGWRACLLPYCEGVVMPFRRIGARTPEYGRIEVADMIWTRLRASRAAHRVAAIDALPFPASGRHCLGDWSLRLSGDDIRLNLSFTPPQYSTPTASTGMPIHRPTETVAHRVDTGEVQRTLDSAR
jgi:hypothetical protein